MSAAKKPAHTPGPWEVREGPNDSRAFDVYAGTWKVHHGAWGREADARLIAAAPKLYAALWAICEGMEASGGWEGDDELFNLGMAAIREAEAGHGD